MNNLIPKLVRITVLLILGIFCFKHQLIARNYYVDPSSNLSIANGSFTNPWKTISQVNAGTVGLLPGDSVLFKRGQILSGRLIVYASGTALAPIVYSAYGVGNMPELTYTASDIITITNRQYIVIDGLKIIDKTISITDHTIIAKISYGITLQNSPYCTIKNCEITLVGVAIAVQEGSDFTTIASNYLHNLRAVRNTVGGDDDYGANAMVIGTSNNTISNNRLEDCWATSFDYGYDGGAVEFFGTTISDNKILYNTALNCNGFLEIGSNTYGIASNNLIGYNKIINCGQTGTFHNKKNGFAVQIDNLKFYNNVIIENKIQFNKIRTLFWYSDPSKIDMVIIRNNIIWLSTGENVVNSYQDTSQLIHTNNIYKIRNGIIGYSIDSSERYYIKDEQIFKDTSGTSENWDLHLLPNSPAIDLGIDVGLNKDFDNQSLNGLPDAGVYEYQYSDTIPPLRIITDIGTIKCSGGTTEVTIQATGGSPPYNGTGTYILKAGTYTFIVNDAVGNSKSLILELIEPPPLQFSIEYTILTNYNSLTNLRINAKGGVAPYTYQLNNGIFQSSNVFYNLSFGKYLITIKDGNGCITSQEVNLVVTSITVDPDKKLTLRVTPNPSNNYFTVNTIKYRGSFVTMNINVYNGFGQLVYSARGMSNVTYTFGANFIPGNYVLVAQVDGTVQVVKLVKL